MTRKQRSEHMKAIWVRRRAAKSALTVTKPKDELDRLSEIVRLMQELSVAGRQYLVNRFM